MTQYTYDEEREARREAARKRREEAARERRRDKIRELLGPIGRMDIFVNNKRFGRIFFHPRVVALGMAAFMLFNGGKAAFSLMSDKEVSDPVPVSSSSDIGDPLDDDFRYSVPYRITYGDTIEGIISEYEPDVNKMYEYKRQVLSKNDLGTGSFIYAGDEIVLYGVPGDKLEEYGYSCDYSLYDPFYEIRDRKDFLEQNLKNIAAPGDLQVVYDVILEQFKELKEVTRDCYATYNEEHQEYLVEYLVDSYRNMCDQVEEIFGVKFKPKCYSLADVKIDKEEQRKGY